MNRQPYPTTQILVRSELQRSTLLAKASQIPLDADKPVEVIIREWVKPRKKSQNDLMWACQLKDISEQAYVSGRTYSAEVWHEFYKEQFLPLTFDAEMTKEGYRKYDESPCGKKILIGSTTHLTVKGFAQYLLEVEAHGASLGVEFGARE